MNIDHSSQNDTEGKNTNREKLLDDSLVCKTPNFSIGSGHMITPATSGKLKKSQFTNLLERLEDKQCWCIRIFCPKKNSKQQQRGQSKAYFENPDYTITKIDDYDVDKGYIESYQHNTEWWSVN